MSKETKFLILIKMQKNKNRFFLNNTINNFKSPDFLQGR